MSGFVYVIQCGEHVKIGWSRNPKSRLSVAKNFNARPVAMVTYFPATQHEEKALHDRFSAHRVGSGEWFHYCSELREWAESINTFSDDVLVSWMNANRGSKIRLARLLGLTPGAVSQWRKAPEEHLIAIRNFTGIPRQLLRPDLYVGMTEAS